MNVQELQQSLLSKGLRPNAVSFQTNILTAAEQYCIAHSNGCWEVYYFERGNKNDLQHFNKEESACDHLLKLLLADKTVWVHPSRN